MTITAATPPATPTPPTATVVAPPSRGGGAAVRLSATQLRVNQRIAQAGVRRANVLASTLATGFSAGDFRQDHAESLDPSLRPAP